MLGARLSGAAMRPATVTPATIGAAAPQAAFHLSPVPEARKKRRIVRIRMTSAAGTGFAYTTNKYTTPLS